MEAPIEAYRPLEHCCWCCNFWLDLFACLHSSLNVLMLAIVTLVFFQYNFWIILNFQSGIDKKRKIFFHHIVLLWFSSLSSLKAVIPVRVMCTNTLECVHYNKCQDLNFLQMHFGDFTFASQFWSITYLDFFGSIISAQYMLCGQTFDVFMCPEHTKRSNTVQPFFRLKKRPIFKVSIFALCDVSELLQLASRRCLQSLDKCRPDV